MLKLATCIAAAGLSVVIATAAEAKPQTLAECYDLVIAGCNKTKHPQPCASSGFDDCDEIFPVPLVGDPGEPPRRMGLTARE